MDERGAAELPDDAAVLKQLVAQLLERVGVLERRNEQLTHQLEQLKRMYYGPRSERLAPEQMLMPFATQSFPAQLPPPGTPPRASGSASALAVAARPAENGGHGRQKLPEHLKRVEVLHDLPAEEKRCRECRGELAKIGEETAEQLEFTPSQVHVLRHVRPKYACRACQGHVVIAPPATGPIDKALPGPGLLAYVAVAKYDDHLPLYRQEEIFRRQGVEIARSTMCDWVGATAELLAPVALLMKKEVLASKKIHTDDIPVPVQDATRDSTREGRLWVYIGDEKHPYTVFDYSPNHECRWPLEFLSGFEGCLQSDAYTGYDGLYTSGAVIEVGCWAHARRRFFDAQTTDAARATIALAYIRELYAVEDEAKEMKPPDRLKIRQERSRRVVSELRSWLDSEGVRILPKSAMGEAFGYVRNQWTALTQYLGDADLDIDNNVADRALRGVAIGRKNWLFAGSDEGGRRAAVIYSVIETCKRHGLEPYAYIRDILNRISSYPARAIAQLLPGRWQSPMLSTGS